MAVAMAVYIATVMAIGVADCSLPDTLLGSSLLGSPCRTRETEKKIDRF